jgi:hypothetical protein
MRSIVGILVALALLAVAGNAQTFRGAINGTVTDPSGAVVAGATVKATNTGTGIAQTSSTTSDGQYSFQDLPLGTYSIAVTASGFPVTTVDKIEVTAGSAYTLPVKLSIAKQTTTVEVSAAALTLATTTATQDNILTTEAVQDERT